MKKVLRFCPRLAFRMFDKKEPPKAVSMLQDYQEPLVPKEGSGKSRKRWKSPHVRKRSPKATSSRRSPAKGKASRKSPKR